MNPNRHEKLEALLRFASHGALPAPVVFLVGFLAGRIGRVHFAQDVTGAPNSLILRSQERILWPGMPFAAHLHGVAVADPVMLVMGLAPSEDIWVSLEFEGARNAPWYQAVAWPSYQEGALEVGTKRPAHEARADELRAEVDRALDIYGEVLRMMERDDPARRQELAFYLSLAQQQVQELSRELSRLEQDVKQRAEDRP